MNLIVEATLPDPETVTFAFGTGVGIGVGWTALQAVSVNARAIPTLVQERKDRN
jgi:hypothetical protein